jgi:hypothetical protein
MISEAKWQALPLWPVSRKPVIQCIRDSVTVRSGAGNVQICLFLTKVFVSETFGFDVKRLSSLGYVKMTLWLYWTCNQPAYTKSNTGSPAAAEAV